MNTALVASATCMPHHRASPRTQRPVYTHEALMRRSTGVSRRLTNHASDPISQQAVKSVARVNCTICPSAKDICGKRYVDIEWVLDSAVSYDLAGRSDVLQSKRVRFRYRDWCSLQRLQCNVSIASSASRPVSLHDQWRELHNLLMHNTRFCATSKRIDGPLAVSRAQFLRETHRKSAFEACGKSLGGLRFPKFEHGMKEALGGYHNVIKVQSLGRRSCDLALEDRNLQDIRRAPIRKHCAKQIIHWCI